jgi:hypothetical protein
MAKRLSYESPTNSCSGTGRRPAPQRPDQDCRHQYASQGAEDDPISKRRTG